MMKWFFWPILFILSLIYGLVVCVRNFLFRNSILKTKKVDRPVICVGNISVGGSGKTALVLELLDLIPNLCVLTRGYKSQITRQKRYPAFVPNANEPKLYGDEPSLLKSKHPNSFIVIDPNRFRGAKYALEVHSNISGFVMDDGFQHRSLSKDFNIVLFDVDTYQKKPGLLPLGRFREPLSSLKRADLISVTKWAHLKPEYLNGLQTKLKKFCNTVELLDSKIVSVENNNDSKLTSGPVLLVSGLGQPDVFEQDLKRDFKNILILEHLKYPDHYNFERKDLEMLILKAQSLNCKIICSEKDYIKLASLNMDLDLIYYTRQKIVLSDNTKNMILNALQK